MKYKSTTRQYLFVILIFVILIGLALAFTTDNPRYDLILSSKGLLFSAFLTTIWVSIFSLACALVLGFILWVMSRSSMIILRAIANVFSEIIMGTPQLVMIFLIVYPFGSLIGCKDKLLLGILSLILYNAPYIANAYEATASVVGSEQYIVMDLYHFKWYQKYRYVILPQMIKPFIPSLVNQLSSVIKASSLLNIIAISEITYITTSIATRSYTIIEGYYIMWIMYLIVTIPLSLIAKYIANKMS
ncbi:MAG: ABC transporter permease subunit [Lachnospiraceae bacterium]